MHSQQSFPPVPTGTIAQLQNSTSVLPSNCSGSRPLLPSLQVGTPGPRGKEQEQEQELELELDQAAVLSA